MDVDVTIRYSDDRLCEVVVCQPKSFLGPIGVDATTLKSPRPNFPQKALRDTGKPAGVAKFKQTVSKRCFRRRWR
jgi:hypothetical protein